MAALAALAMFVSSAPAQAEGDPSTAALQVALLRLGVYAGPVDGVAGTATSAAVRALQSAHGLTADGIAGPQTRRLLGPYGRHELGSRPLALGATGWDVAELQFALAWHGFPSGDFTGRFDTHLLGALRRFQRFSRLAVDGVAGAGTVAALRRPLPAPGIALAWPVTAAVGDRYGPRGDRFHAGVDLVADAGTPVRAAAAGRVTWVGWRDGWGLAVTVAHAGRVRTLYAHLSATSVQLGQRVEQGTTLGTVGSTGDASGPHLHLEVRVGGASVDPLGVLG